jgi:UDP-glucose 4-epimerase
MSSGERPAGDRPRKVVVTGIAGRLGQIVAQSLHRDPGFAIEGLDRRPFPRRPKDLVHHEVDLRSKKAKDVFRHGDVDALIHLGLMHDPRASAAEIYSWNVGGTSRLLEYCQTYRVPKLVVLSSANVYGPRTLARSLFMRVPRPAAMINTIGCGRLIAAECTRADTTNRCGPPPSCWPASRSPRRWAVVVGNRRPPRRRPRRRRA